MEETNELENFLSGQGQKPYEEINEFGKQERIVRRHRKFKRKAQERSAWLSGEWVSLPASFLHNRALPASLYSSLRNSRLCPGRHTVLCCTQLSINDAACLMAYTCHFWVKSTQRSDLYDYLAVSPNAPFWPSSWVALHTSNRLWMWRQKPT